MTEQSDEYGTVPPIGRRQAKCISELTSVRLSITKFGDSRKLLRKTHSLRRYTQPTLCGVIVER